MNVVDELEARLPRVAAWTFTALGASLGLAIAVAEGLHASGALATMVAGALFGALAARRFWTTSVDDPLEAAALGILTAVTVQVALAVSLGAVSVGQVLLGPAAIAAAQLVHALDPAVLAVTVPVSAASWTLGALAGLAVPPLANRDLASLGAARQAAARRLTQRTR